MPTTAPDLSTASLPALGRILDDGSHPHWWYAYDVFMRRPDQRTAPRVLRLIQTLTDSEQRTALLIHLGFLLEGSHSPRLPRIVAVLTTILANIAEKPKVRGAAAEALGLIGHRAAYKPLIAALTDPAAEVRLFAAFALGDLGDPRAIPALQQRLTDRARVRGFGTVAADARKSIRQLTHHVD